MRKLRALLLRLLGAGRTKREFDAELESHVALDTDEGVRAGLSEQEARRRALIKLGGSEQARQSYRERATLPLVETLRQDVRYALRGFRRNPIFALTAIVTLTLGIGATTAVFSVVDRILFRALPYARSGSNCFGGHGALVGAPGVPHGALLRGVARQSEALFFFRGTEHRGPQLRPD